MSYSPTHSPAHSRKQSSASEPPHTHNNPIKGRIPEDQPLSKDEQETIDLMYKQLGDALDAANVSEGTMLRFIRGYKDDPNPQKKAIDMMRTMLDWRKKELVDEWGLTPGALPREDQFRRMWLSGLHGRSRDGHPLYIEKLGSIDPSALTKNFTIEDVIKFHVQLMERITAYKDDLSFKENKRIYKHMVIIDLKGVGMSHTGKKFTDPMKSVIHIDQDYYPETLKLMFITNASWIIKTVWALVSPWIDPITKANIKWGSSELEKYIDKDQLPRFLGGTCRCKECFVTEFIPGEGARFEKPVTPTSANRRRSSSVDRIEKQQQQQGQLPQRQPSVGGGAGAQQDGKLLDNPSTIPATSLPNGVSK